MGIGRMEVVLESAKGLKRRDLFGKIDPYVVLQYRNEEQVSKIAKGQDSNPRWNEAFIFMVEYPAAGDGDDKYKLILQIYDSDSYTHDDYLGHTIIDVEELFKSGEEHRTDLGIQKYRVVLDDGTYYGEIKVGVSFQIQEMEYDLY